MFSFVAFQPSSFRRSSRASVRSAGVSGTAARRNFLRNSGHRRTTRGRRADPRSLSDRRIGRQMQPPVAFKANADEANVVVRVKSDFELFRKNQSNELDCFLLHPGKTFRRPPIAVRCGNLAKIGYDAGTFPSGSSCLLAGGVKNLAESRSGKCFHDGLQFLNSASAMCLSFQD